jgi:lysozyme family protein
MKQRLTERQIVELTQREETILRSKQNYLNQLYKVLKDIKIGEETLKEIQKKPETIEVKIAPGILLQAKLLDTQNCKRAFADNGYQPATIKSTITWLNKKEKNVTKQINKVKDDLVKSKTKFNDLINILKKIEQEKQKNISVK